MLVLRASFSCKMENYAKYQENVFEIRYSIITNWEGAWRHAATPDFSESIGLY